MRPVSREALCDTSCRAQSALSCPNDLGYGSCLNYCLDPIPNTPACIEAQDDLSWCMANAPLFCDPQGYAAVSVDDCGDEIDGIFTCQ
jgi:hypothetical protein